MPKLTIHLDKSVDPATAISRFQDAAATWKLPAADLDRLASQVAQTIDIMTRQGADLQAVGSHFNAARTLVVAGHTVIVRAEYGPESRSLMKRFLLLFRSH